MPPKAAAKKTEDIEAINAFFEQYKDPHGDYIAMDGLGRLFTDLGLDPAGDVKCLVIAWRLGAVVKPGQISREEFVEGCKKNGINTIGDLRSRVPSFDPGFLEVKEFRDFYRFTFLFSRELPQHKYLDKDMAAALLPIVIDENRAPHLHHFIEFLNSTDVKQVTLDQWQSFLQFNQAVKVDLSNWADGAWPVMLDEYVEWRNKK